MDKKKKKGFKIVKKKKRKIKEIKKKKKIIKKESELEEDIKNTEDSIKDTEFKEFLQPVEISAPVHKKIETPTLELNISSTLTSSIKEKEAGIDYTARNEPKYSDIPSTDNLDEKKYESEFRTPDFKQPEFQRPQDEFVTSPLQIKEQENENIKFFEQRNDRSETQEKKYWEF